MTWSYVLYGRRLESDRALRWLTPQQESGEPHCRIWFSPPQEQLATLRSLPQHPVYVDERQDEEGRSVATIATLGEKGGYALALRHGLEFFIDPRGQQVWIDWPSDIDLSAAAEVLLVNAVAGIILGLQGIGGMHGSAIVIDGRAIALAGVSGSGKSTLAAALTARGHRLLSDDLVAWVDQEEGLWVQPAFAAFMLWPDALTLIDRSKDTLRPVFPDFAKGLFSFSHTSAVLSPRPAPLTVIYLLTRQVDAVFPVQPLSSGVALAELLAVARTPFHLLGTWAWIQDFARLSTLAARVPIYQLPMTPGAAGLQAVIAELEQP